MKSLNVMNKRKFEILVFKKTGWEDEIDYSTYYSTFIWVETDFSNIKEGNIFRILEKGSILYYDEKGKSKWVALSNVYEDGDQLKINVADIEW